MVVFSVHHHNQRFERRPPFSPRRAVIPLFFLLSLFHSLPRSIFSFNPQEQPLIGEAAVIVVNDVRHELYPEFLQRTVPYFFTFDKLRRCYKWADIAFIQVVGLLEP